MGEDKRVNWRSVRIRVRETSCLKESELDEVARQAQSDGRRIFAWKHAHDTYCVTAIGRIVEWTIVHKPGDVPGADPMGLDCHIDPNGDGSLVVTGPSKMLFTSLRTMLSEDLWELPFGYTAVPFSSHQPFQPGGLWNQWPSQIVRIPETIILWDRAKQTGRRIDLSLSLGSPLDVSMTHPVREHEGEGSVGKGATGQTSHEGETAWSQRVSEAIAACKSTNLRKVVLARSAAVEASDGGSYDGVATFHRLALSYPEHANFLLDECSSTFLGSTPETLIKIEAGHLKTHALAGTFAIPDEEGQGDTRNPLHDSKLREEHALVVEDIVQRLTPWVERLTFSEKPTVRRLRKMAHLETSISGERASGRSVLDYIPRLHPTPALGGFPRGLAQAWLAQHEGLDRGYFGGIVGWFNALGDGHCVVAIRCGLVHGATATAFAGAGIVPGSEPLPEWNETELKMTPFFEHLVESTEDAANVS